MKPLSKLPFQFIRIYKKQSCAIFLSIVFTVALLVSISSLVYTSEKKDLENQKYIYGDYQYSLMADNMLTENIENNKRGEGYTVDKIGLLKAKNTIETPNKIDFIYVDKNYLEIMNQKIIQGSYPSNPNEIALDQYAIRNLNIQGNIGDTITIGGYQYILTGILSNRYENQNKSLSAYVSKNTKDLYEDQILYIKFDETRNIKKQCLKFSENFNLKESQLSDNDNILYVLGGSSSNIINEILWCIQSKEANFTTFMLTLERSFHLSVNGVIVICCIFAAFVIYSVFNVSISKRLSQYGILQTLGISHIQVFGTLFMELLLLLLIGYPIGSILGIIIAKLFYNNFAEIFTKNNAIFKEVHTGTTDNGSLNNLLNNNDIVSKFYISTDAILIGFAVLIILLLLISFILMRKINKNTIISLIRKNKTISIKNRTCHSKRTKQLSNVIINKFMYERKCVFLGVVISLAIGGILFLSTTYVIKNTEENNELTLKVDDGLNSDYQLLTESINLSDGISNRNIEEIKNIKGISEVHPVKYFIGEFLIKEDQLKWKEYFPEVANIKGYTQDARIMSQFNGVCVKTDTGYKIKSNIYGYDNTMLSSLSDYLLDGQVNINDMKKKNSVILRTVVDAQGNYDCIDIKAGDTIKLKVPKSTNIPFDALKFTSNDNFYEEKDFVVSAIIKQSMAKNKYYIEDTGLDIIMSNDQIEENFNIDNYNMASINKSAASNNNYVTSKIKNIVSNNNKILLNDYSEEIEIQKSYLEGKMMLFYGVAIIVLIVSIFHIINSLNHIILNRQYEFGILRAIGIDDLTIKKMILKQGLLYGIYSNIVMIGTYCVMEKVLSYLFEHVYLYVVTPQGINVIYIIFMMLLNISICIFVVLIPMRKILNKSILSRQYE